MLSQTTTDTLLDGAVKLTQPEKGYRAGLDAILLAASLQARPGQHILEIGCGAGAALLSAAHRLHDVRFTGIEREAELCKLAKHNIGLNAMQDRIEISCCDIETCYVSAENAYDQVYANPPYFAPNQITQPSESRAAAYISHTNLEDWLKIMLYVTRPKGIITLIHRADNLGQILTYLHPRSGDITIFPIRTLAGAPAKRVIVRARKALRPGRSLLLAGLDLRIGTDNTPNPAAEAIYAGAGLDWE